MTPDQQTQLEALLTEAGEAENAGNFDQADKLAKAVLAQLESGTADKVTHKLRARAAHRLGNITASQGNNSAALEHYATAQAESETAEDKFGVARAMNGLGTVYLNLGSHDKALEQFSRALSLNEELGDRSEVAGVTMGIGNVYLHLGSYDKALECYARALSEHEELGNISRVARVTGNVGVVYAHLGDYDKALDSFARALSAHEELGNKSLAVTVTGNIGGVYSALGSYDKALEYYARALSAHVELGEKSFAARATGNIGNVYFKLGSYDKALEYFARALDAFEELGEKSDVARITGSIGCTYGSRKDYANTLDYLQRALILAEEIGDGRLVGYWLANIGNTLSDMDEKEEALGYLQRALHHFRYELQTNEGVARTLLQIGSLLARQNNSEEALKTFEEALALAEELGEKAEAVSAHKELATILKAIGKTAESYAHFEKYHDLEKEVQSDAAKKEASLVEQRRQIAEREKEIEIARATAEAKKSATTHLLHRVLPESIATRIIEGEEEIADYFPAVSILFADIKGFTVISAGMPAYIVVRFLKFVFGEFDRIMAKHGCEKIKTIGDGYMAVAGAPIECADHAERLAAAALEMQQPVILPEDIRQHMPEGTLLGVRIGLHTGSVVAGVIGEERFVYDIYSDAVNTASRMESHGEQNKIHCSDDFYRHLQNRFATTKNTAHGFVFEKRGEMEIKGKGTMRTYFLEKA